MKKYAKLSERKRRTRVRLAKSAEKSGRLRLTVFRSNYKIYGQIIDDAKGKTLVFASDSNLPKNKGVKMTKGEKAFVVGELIAKKAKAKKIKNVYFDRGSYKYHGRVKALAEGARKGGLNF